jgi:S1-C subfamily serine protease
MQKGCVVEALLPGSPAEDYLKKGDVLVSVSLP